MSAVTFAHNKSKPLPETEEKEELTSVRITVNPVQSRMFSPPRSSQSTAGSFSIGAQSSGWCPILFERASKAWWDPRFDSKVLEEQYHRSTFPLTCQRFQYALLYLFLASVSYCIYFACMAHSDWIPFVVTSFVLMCYIVATLLFTYTKHYQKYYFSVSLFTTVFLCALSLSVFASYIGKQSTADLSLSPIGIFCICLKILLILYTVIPLPLYLCFLIGGTYSIIFEALSAVLTEDNTSLIIGIKVMLQMCIHMIGILILLMAEVRMRKTFMKVGQSLLVRRDLEVEQQLKERMIHSVMPPKVAKWLMSTQDREDEEQQKPESGKRRISTSPRQSQMIFRPFNMHRMEEVSILFADIVGFTKMSSNKTAEQLVGLLNDLFGRFDYLCAKLGCEKISTLGDCYYCVSGCPEPRSDHAKCCVEMGLAIIKAIGEFDEDTNEDVNMRVGVHTGTVLCGIVGTRRFKFDVWSNDVTFANLMESTGKPGCVHVSEATFSYIQDIYTVEEGLPQHEVKTYFIRGRKLAARSGNRSCRHSWPTNSIPLPNIHHPGGRKANSLSERGNDSEGDGSTMPMLQPQRHGSLSTLTSSRKDSGIRSRRSSLQDVMLDTSYVSPTNLLSHRVGPGCFTSSQTSLADTGRGSGSSVKGCSLLVDPTLSLNESLARLRHLRKQSDLQMIRCVQQDAGHIDYFVKPPISQLSLFFVIPAMERDYRQLHYRDSKDVTLTVSSATFNMYCDVFVSAVVYIVIAVSCFMLFHSPLPWLLFCLLATCWEMFIILLCLRETFASRGYCRAACLSQVYRFCTQWYPWHICGAILVSLPVASVFSNFSCGNVLTTPEKTHAFLYLMFVSIFHFCNFTHLNCWLKSILASTAVAGLVLLLSASYCQCSVDYWPEPTSVVSTFNRSDFLGPDDMVVETNTATVLYHCGHSLVYEIILDGILITILIWFLNREFEISYRLSFHGSVTAARDKKKIQAMKNQADWLLHNIIPKHVAEQLKSTSKYSENHKDAGIIFASIVNFHEMYDESYEGGKEYLRVLNELIGDFDELLNRPEFKNVEKIKTIGSTFMAASGLNPHIRQQNPHPCTHLFELMDFALAMQQVIERFNCDLLEFSFIFRIGYNFGDVTAGVIGTTKLYYDIWGDAVNIASRMDSTGIPGHIQVPEHCMFVLQDVFEFEKRGSVYVKGKDDMNVYTLVKKKDGVDYPTLPLAEPNNSSDEELETEGSPPL
ncbi:adenylate cyclase type 9-like isoform X1 [Limulus polyphemus]|uniref:adenylate cyclase n=1 Tax=Limulus polyphemus TaxID=6850 RepID=A0ABM1SUM4_LIMPO|nr:adenylate cyclase type 9-like isoform X1 [Limulus polyphemus]